MDLERLDEALAFWDKGAEIHGGYPSDMTPIIDAARLLANGERVEWCEEHSSPAHGASCTYVKAYWNEFMQPCRIVSRLLVDPSTEED